jgi:5'-nucleotidase
LLLTNDDGIESSGLRLLAQNLVKRYDLVVVAPREDRSGSGTGIGRFDPAKGVGLSSAKLEGVDAYTIDGPPGLAVMAGALGAFGRVPDLIVSGINAGMNTGHSVIHSGTVGAALTARTFGASGLAVSLRPSDPWQWDTAIQVAEGVVDWLLSRTGMRMVLNVNVPAVPINHLRGVTWAKLDEFGYFRLATVNSAGERLQFEVAATDSGRRADSDTARCFDDFVTVTPLTAVETNEIPPDAVETVCGWPYQP